MFSYSGSLERRKRRSSAHSQRTTYTVTCRYQNFHDCEVDGTSSPTRNHFPRLRGALRRYKKHKIRNIFIRSGIIITMSFTPIVTSLAAGVGGTGTGLLAFGFTSSGIAAGSIAAGIQAGIGNVVAGSTFAALQSFGALGGPIVMVSIAIGFLVVLLVCYILKRTSKTG